MCASGNRKTNDSRLLPLSKRMCLKVIEVATKDNFIHECGVLYGLSHVLIIFRVQ